MREADTFCRGQGRQLMPVHTNTQNGGFNNFGHSSVQFRCLAANDPELHTVRASDLSPDRRRLLVPIPDRENIRALVPPMVLRELDAWKVPEPLLAAERAIATTGAVAKLLPHPDLITRSLERRGVSLGYSSELGLGSFRRGGPCVSFAARLAESSCNF
jgi:hypothetical protein